MKNVIFNAQETLLVNNKKYIFLVWHSSTYKPVSTPFYVELSSKSCTILLSIGLDWLDTHFIISMRSTGKWFSIYIFYFFFCLSWIREYTQVVDDAIVISVCSHVDHTHRFKRSEWLRSHFTHSVTKEKLMTLTSFTIYRSGCVFIRIYT